MSSYGCILRLSNIMKTNKKLERIRERRNRVYFTIKFRVTGTISFDSIGLLTEFSRAEVAYHIAALVDKKDKRNKIAIHTNGEFYHHKSDRERERDLEIILGLDIVFHGNPR